MFGIAYDAEFWGKVTCKERQRQKPTRPIASWGQVFFKSERGRVKRGMRWMGIELLLEKVSFSGGIDSHSEHC
jgi:hypothetical protein